MISPLRLLLCAFLVSGALSAQPGPGVFLPRPGETVMPDTIFYPFYNDVQMIEIDNVGAWERDVAIHEMSQPRSLSWSMLIPGPFPNVLLFRNTEGTIVKAFNTTVPLDSLTKAFSRVPVNKKSTGTYALTHRYHKHTPHSNWYDQRSRQNDFNGFYAVYDDSSLYRNTSFWFGHMPSPRKTGLIDSLGDVFLPVEYAGLIPLEDHILVVKDGVCGIMDKKKSFVLPMQYEAYRLQSENEVVFLNEGKIQAVYETRKSKVNYTDSWDYIAFDELHTDRFNRRSNSRINRYKFRKDGLTGMIDSNYQVVVPANYDLISWYSDGLAVACRDQKFGYVNEKGDEVIPCVYTYAEYFRQGYGVVQHEGSFRNVNRKGELQKTNTVEHEDWRNNKYTQYANVGTLKAIQTSSGVGLAGPDDVFVIPPIYEDIKPLSVISNGKSVKSSVYFMVKRFGKVGIMDTAGNLMLPIEYEMIGDNPGLYGFRIVKVDNQHWGVINSSFAMIVPCLYEGISIGHADTYFTFWKNNKCGIMDTNGRVIIPAIYRSIYSRQNGRMLAKKDSLFGFIDTLGNTVIPFRYQQFHNGFFNGLIGFCEHGKWGFMDSTGAVIIPAQYKEARRFQSDITGVLLNDKWGFINRKGKLVVDYQYDFVGHEWFADGTVEVRRNGWIGFVNERGKEVIPCIYQGSWGFSKDLGHYLERNGKKEYVKVR
jgi:hypothetical protein